MAKPLPLRERVDQLVTTLDGISALGDVEVLLKGLVAEKASVAAAGRGSGRRRSTPRGSKAKGRAGVEAAHNFLLMLLRQLDGGIVPEDLLIQTTSVGGSDIHSSPRVSAVWPFAPEIKNVETLNIWKALEQARLNAVRKRLSPVLFFRRNNSKLFIAMESGDFARFVALTRQQAQDDLRGAVLT